MTDWDCVKEFYKTTFGIDEWIVELYANLDILQLCASGASNRSIAKFTDLDLDDVVEIILTTFNFPGWKEDLPVNPYKLWLECEPLGINAEVKFASEMEMALSHVKDREDLIYQGYWISKVMKEIEERIADEWI